MIVRIIVPPGGLKYPDQVADSERSVALSFVLTDKHIVTAIDTEINFDNKLRVMFNSAGACKREHNAYLAAYAAGASNHEISADVLQVCTADPNIYSDELTPVELWK